jgi:hypothetical protein
VTKFRKIFHAQGLPHKNTLTSTLIFDAATGEMSVEVVRTSTVESDEIEIYPIAHYIKSKPPRNRTAILKLKTTLVDIGLSIEPKDIRHPLLKRLMPKD